MKHIKDIVNELEVEFYEKTVVDPVLVFAHVSSLRKAVELYGKEVARNVRHMAAEIAVENDDAHGDIMNIQFKDVDSNP